MLEWGGVKTIVPFSSLEVDEILASAPVPLRNFLNYRVLYRYEIWRDTRLTALRYT